MYEVMGIRKLRTIANLWLLLVIQPVFSFGGAFFNILETGVPIGTNNTQVSLTLCLNGYGPLSCQNYKASSLNFEVTTTIPKHNYSAAGIKINTPGYTISGCTPIANGYCLFSVNNTTAAALTLSVNNIVPMVVKAGPSEVSNGNTAFVSLTVCEPGTTNCQTVDNIQVDTGSTGIRVIADVLNKSLNFPPVIANGSPLAECSQFTSSSTWGSIKWADVTIGGETAYSIPIQIIGDNAPPYATVPSSCPTPITDTVASFGANGIIGINQLTPDCGAMCTDSDPPVSGFYYSCDDSSCLTSTNVSLEEQVPQPVVYFNTDNNGVILQLPAISNAGAVSLLGSLIFGIGTQPNNQLVNKTIYPTDSSGNFTTLYNNETLTSYTDSGTQVYVFPNDTTPPIPVSGDVYNPPSPLLLQAINIGYGGMPSGTVDFTLVSQSGLAAGITAAFIGSPGAGFTWGLPFFYGRTVFVAINGAATPYGSGPYVAY